MLKLFQHAVPFLIGIFLCEIPLLPNVYGKRFEVGLQGNVVKILEPDPFYSDLKTGYGVNGKIRYWWKSYNFALDVEYFQHSINWQPFYDIIEHSRTRPPYPPTTFLLKKATMIGIYPEVGFDILPGSSKNLIFSFGTGLYLFKNPNIFTSSLSALWEKNVKIYTVCNGLTTGFNFEIPIIKKLNFALGLKYNIIFTQQKRTRFITTSGGVVF